MPCAHSQSAIGHFIKFSIVVGSVDSNRNCKAGHSFSGAINREAANTSLSCFVFKTYSNYAKTARCKAATCTALDVKLQWVV